MKRSAFAPDHHQNTPTAPPQTPDSAGMSMGWVYGSVILQWSLAQSPVRKSPQCPRGEDNATVECGSSTEVCAYHRDHEAFFIFRTSFYTAVRLPPSVKLSAFGFLANASLAFSSSSLVFVFGLLLFSGMCLLASHHGQFWVLTCTPG